MTMGISHSARLMGGCSGERKDCWQKAIDKLKEEGEPIL